MYIMNIRIQRCLFHIQIGIAVWMTYFSHLNAQEMEILKILSMKLYLKLINLNGYCIYIENTDDGCAHAAVIFADD